MSFLATIKLSRAISLRGSTVDVLTAAVVVLAALAPAPAAPQAMTPPHLAETSFARALTTYRALSEGGGWPSVQAGRRCASGMRASV